MPLKSSMYLKTNECASPYFGRLLTLYYRTWKRHILKIGTLNHNKYDFIKFKKKN